jgi:hypothetical protein
VSTSVRTFLPVVGDVDGLIAAFEGDPKAWLHDAKRDGPDHWLVQVRAGALSRQVRAYIGAPWRAGPTRWRTLSWDPVPGERDAVALERFLPSLDGELGLHVETDGGATLMFDARYQPPGGALGAAVDAVALHRLAKHSVERFVEGLAAALVAEAALYRPPRAGDPEALPHDVAEA